MRSILCAALCLVCALSLLFAAAAPATATETVLLDDIEIRDGVTVDLAVTVHGDLGSKDCHFAVHGGTFTGATWRPYAETLLAARGGDACVLALDMPVRRGSGVPEGALFGDLDLDDYVSMVIATLDRLAALDIEPTTILGHSMGGTLVQMTQQRLVDEGTNLEHRFDIREAILVAPDLPAEVPWALGDGGGLSDLIEAFAVDEPGLGTLFEIPAALWPAFFFTNLSGEVDVYSPTVEELEAAGYNALGEPLLAIHQLNGTGGFASRPSIDAGIFVEDTRLRLVSFGDDIYVQPSETAALYEHLTGDAAGSCYILLTGPDTVHTLQFSRPDRLVAAIDDLAGCAYGDGE